jgi:hypothetical protein
MYIYGGKNVQKWMAVVTCIMTLFVIIFGHLYWNGKIKRHVNASESITKAEKEDASEQYDVVRHLPDELVEKVEKAAETDVPLNFVIYGSEATSTDEQAWPNRLKENLEKNYNHYFNISIYSDEGKTTKDVIAENLYEKIVAEKPDVLLFEPFILKDNGGGVGIENTIQNITSILNEVQKANPEVTIYLQPAHPLYNAVNYPRQVERLKEYAEENDYIFLDHWTAWPEQDNQELKTYLVDENNKPNEKGNKVWADYLINYFYQGLFS